MSSSSSTSFFARWVTAVTLSLALAAAAAFSFMWSAGEVVEDAAGEAAAIVVVMGIFGAAFGGGLGLGQSLLLRSLGVPARPWIIQTLIAGAVGMATGFSILSFLTDLEQVPEAVAATVVGISVGLPAGLLQWRILKRHLSQAHWWLPISLLALLVALAVGLPMGGEGRELISLGVVGLLNALISGAGMTWLWQSRPAAAI